MELAAHVQGLQRELSGELDLKGNDGCIQVITNTIKLGCNVELKYLSVCIVLAEKRSLKSKTDEFLDILNIDKKGID